MKIAPAKRRFEIQHPAVLLLGAGATRGALGSQHVPPPVDKDFFEIAGQIGGRGTRAVVRKVLRSVWELYGRTNNVGLEEYYREVETRARIGNFARSQNQPRDWNRRKKDLEELIRRVYIHTTVDMSKTPPRPLHSQVHEALLARLDSGDTIVTFNYDLLIEESFLTAKVWNPTDGFSIGVSGISHDWTRRWLKSRKVTKRHTSKVHLLKLHGSLGWARYPNRNVRLKQRPYVVRKGVTENIFVCPPGWNKPIDKNPFKALWREARLKIEACTSLIVIGYSLPETDLLAKALFSEAVRMRSTRKNYISNLVLVDPIEHVKNKFTMLFTPALGAYGRISRFDSLAELGHALGLKTP